MKREPFQLVHIKDSKGIHGAERVILTLGKHLCRDKYRFLLLCMRNRDEKGDALIQRARELEIDVVPVDVKGRIDLRAIGKIRRILKDRNTILLHTHDYKSDIYGLVASSGMAVKRVMTAHGSTRDSLLKRTYLFLTETGTYRFADRIVAVSEKVSEELQRQGVAGNKIAVIQNGIDLSLLDGSKAEDEDNDISALTLGKKTFALVGRLFPDKGHSVFLKAFSKVAQSYPAISGLIFGDGPWKEEILKQIRRLKLEADVHLCGVRKNMARVYENIDYLVIASFREGLPYVLLEAMGKRVPVLATAVGDIPLVIEHGKTGILVSPGDAQGLAGAMRHVLGDGGSALKMAERAYELVTEKFSARRMVSETEDLYGTLLEAKNLKWKRLNQ